jgi:hypothetical protein
MVRTAFLGWRWPIIAVALAAVGWAGAGHADPVSVKVQLSGAEEVPPVQTAGSGVADLVYDPATLTVKWVINYSGLSGPAMMAHFHGPAGKGSKGPVLLWLSKKGSPAESPITGEATLTPEQADQLAAGQVYLNVHTQTNPGGEIRGQVLFPKN